MVAAFFCGVQEGGMGAPGLAIHMGLEAGELRRLARRETDGRVTARLFAIANVLDGMSRTAAAEAAGMDRQTLRDWVIRYNERGSAGSASVGAQAQAQRWSAGGPQSHDPPGSPP